MTSDNLVIWQSDKSGREYYIYKNDQKLVHICPAKNLIKQISNITIILFHLRGDFPEQKYMK